MKKLFYIVLFIFTFSSYSYAGVIKLWGGSLSSYILHESGHVIAARATDNNTKWNSGTIEFESNNKSDVGFILSAGLLSQLISSEVILQTDKINNNDDFVRGMMLINIIIPLRYSIDYWFIHSLNRERSDDGYSGDIQGIEHHFDRKTADYFAGSVLAITCYQAYRFYKTQSWVTKKTKNVTSDIFINPAKAGGFIITYRKRF
jgi:hypothetical protein